MHFLKPDWVNHDDNKPIFSVDIHPRGGKFATGGQGGEGGRVVIWNLAPVLDEEAELNKNVPKMLCQMDNHLGCVNIVRWSNEGHLLASGGDDKLVMIWKLTGEGSSTIFGGSGKVNHETWRCSATLNSHNGDVLDLAWAPHDGWLASGSVDNTVIIWNANKFPEKVTVLKGHMGLVKGVTWDPIGKYIASQSDDRSLRVWRTADWAQQEVITDCFVDCSATTHVLRLSWSPDGQYLVSAHAMNGGGSTAQIIERDGWKHDKDFVGHRKAVTCVRFNSNIFKKVISGSPKFQQYCCCAIGSRDCSLSVWLTNLKRPLVVIKDLFEDSILDLSWSSDGMNLLACSWDGTVACISFSPDEIGKPLTTDEKNILYEKIYGKTLQKNWNQCFTGSQIIENPEMLQTLDSMAQIQSQEDKKEVTTAPKSLVIPEVIKSDVSLSPNVLVPTNKQIETVLPSGKRRITPMLLTPALTPTKDSLQLPFLNEETTTSLSKSSPSKSKIVIETRKEVIKDVTVPSQALSEPLRVRNTGDAPIVHPPGVQVTQLMCTDVPGDKAVVHFIDMLPPQKMPSDASVAKKTMTYKVQVTNSCQVVSKNKFSKIEVFKLPEEIHPVWETYLGSSIRCLASNLHVVIACCEDLSMNCFNIKSGARTLPSLHIEDLVVSLSLTENSNCLVLTRTGLLYMWDLQKAKALVNRVSVRSLISNNVTVNGCRITSSGQPLVTLSDGKAFSYSCDLQTWVLLSNPVDAISKAGGSMSRSVSNILPLASLQKAMPVQGNNDSLPSGIILSFLENQIAASTVLQSASEFKHWLITTVNHLLDKGPECRLRFILDDLMGPTHSFSNKKEGVILGISKHSLLNEILGIIKTKLPWQRLYNEYKEQFELLNSL
ncbi:protein HIRA homolog [Agrilus planipennis]|uniref:Protein HIRA n=1 Tax=Agrilus planipennis TaxID=224129 RepID=A0A1W4XJ25_AGRPL|nr:protein HIRA homolog [Agrilus planipennis]